MDHQVLPDHPSAHRPADQHRPLESLGREDGSDVVGPDAAAAVGLGVVRLCRGAMAAQVEGHDAAASRQLAPDLWGEAEVALREAVHQHHFGARRIAPFVDREAGAVGGADVAPRPLGYGVIRHFFSMFQCTTTGAFSQPVMLARAAPGPNHMPSQAYCAWSIARFCTASASALLFVGSVSRE